MPCPHRGAAPCPPPPAGARMEPPAAESAQPSLPAQPADAGGRSRHPAQTSAGSTRCCPSGQPSPPAVLRGGRVGLLPAGVSQCRSLLPFPLTRPSAPAVRRPAFCLRSGRSFVAGLWRRVRVVKVVPALYTFNLWKFTRIKTPFQGQGTCRRGLEGRGGLA